MEGIGYDAEKDDEKDDKEATSRKTLVDKRV